MELIRASRCPRCGSTLVPPVRICPDHPVQTEPVVIAGYGTVRSYTTLSSAPEGFKGPLQIALVELAGGARIFCHGKDGRDLKIGRSVIIEQVDGVFYFAHLNVADRLALFWKRGGTARARAAGAMKGTAKRVGAFATVLKRIPWPGAQSREEPGQQSTEALRMETRNTDLPLVGRAESHRARTAIIDSNGTYTYERLLDASARVASALLQGARDLEEKRIPFLVTPGFAWVAVQWGIWRAGAIAAPLPMGVPATELEYVVHDAQATALVADAAGGKALSGIAKARAITLLSTDEALAAEARTLPHIENARRAMILYTSGTTSRPKGAVTTHENIAAQITSLTTAWKWSERDRILLCLPLHHVHGIINVVSCALWSGATCEMLPRFDANTVWDRIASGQLTLFMAVPTIYTRLIASWEAASPERRSALSRACAGLRLMVSGSAALPVSTLERWEEISGHTLLERYGMTEIGMALSNPLEGERIPGSVGMPLPGVEVQLVDENGNKVEADAPGEIEVRGPTVFKEYWGKPEATRQAFREGWFRTGDVAVFENGRYRILGRMNIDIIKTGGHKVSALEIEEQLRQHPAVAECAVVGVPDLEWGERVAAAVVLTNTNGLDLESLRSWAKERLAPFKVPSRLRIVDALPRNAMGKVTKPAVAKMFESETEEVA
jgi:malonyl-CoA/methylmalonyl-CoA synthetase